VATLQSIQIRRLASRQKPEAPLDPDRIEFGRVTTPNFFVADYRHGSWQDARIEPLHNFSLPPTALVFHYAQSIFEGLKAYHWADGSIALFRPEANARRFMDSATRMTMPLVPEELFLDAVMGVADLEREFIPREPGSLYIRPAMIASEACLGVRGSSEFLFFVVALPTGAYFKETKGGLGSITVQISESAARAAMGGTGNVKAAANYAVTLKTIDEAKHQGCAQVLYLDAKGRRLVEEMGGMNIFFVRQGQLVTPPLSDTILAGVTRDSILRVAAHLGIPHAETPLHIDEIVAGIQSGKVSEAIACGTAAVITGIGAFRFEDGRIIHVGNGQPGPITSQLYEILTGIQFGHQPDPFGWVRKVPRFDA
jgi:branched-chain amino acid aminotransferase